MFDLSTVKGDTWVTFLDEFRIVVLTEDVPEFTLFDTDIPPGHPVNSRRFLIPPRYRDWYPSVHLDSDRCLGTLDRDRALTTDPAQAVLVVKLINDDCRCVLFTVQIQTLIEHVCSMNPDTCVPWNVWGRDVAVLEIPISRGARPSILVQGVRVIVAKMCTLSGTNGSHPSLCIFDFSWQGWGPLSPWEETDGGERRVLLGADQRSLLWRLSEDDSVADRFGFYTMGDGNFAYLVSHSHRWKSDYKLMPW